MFENESHHCCCKMYCHGDNGFMRQQIIYLKCEKIQYFQPEYNLIKIGKTRKLTLTWNKTRTLICLGIRRVESRNGTIPKKSNFKF